MRRRLAAGRNVAVRNGIYPLIGSKGVAAASGSPAGGLPDVGFFLLSR